MNTMADANNTEWVQQTADFSEEAALLQALLDKLPTSGYGTPRYHVARSMFSDEMRDSRDILYTDFMAADETFEHLKPLVPRDLIFILQAAVRCNESDDGNDYLTASGLDEVEHIPTLVAWLLKKSGTVGGVLDSLFSAVIPGWTESKEAEELGLILPHMPIHLRNTEPFAFSGPTYQRHYYWEHILGRLKANERESGIADEEPHFYSKLEAEAVAEADERVTLAMQELGDEDPGVELLNDLANVWENQINSNLMLLKTNPDQPWLEETNRKLRYKILAVTTAMASIESGEEAEDDDDED